MTSSTVTCSFKMDRETYDKFKSVVTASGQNVKGNLVRYMQDVIAYGTPNPETIEAIKEVDKLKKNPHKKTYASFSQLMNAVENDETEND